MRGVPGLGGVLGGVVRALDRADLGGCVVEHVGGAGHWPTHLALPGRSTLWVRRRVLGDVLLAVLRALGVVGFDQHLLPELGHVDRTCRVLGHLSSW